MTLINVRVLRQNFQKIHFALFEIRRVIKTSAGSGLLRPYNTELDAPDFGM